jgi:hypothetical protein
MSINKNTHLSRVGDLGFLEALKEEVDNIEDTPVGEGDIGGDSEGSGGQLGPVGV